MAKAVHKDAQRRCCFFAVVLDHFHVGYKRFSFKAKCRLYVRRDYCQIVCTKQITLFRSFVVAAIRSNSCQSTRYNRPH